MIAYPPQDRRLHQLTALYEAYQRHPTHNSGKTLIWLNLLRGVIKQLFLAPGLPFLMNRAGKTGIIRRLASTRGKLG